MHVVWALLTLGMVIAKQYLVYLKLTEGSLKWLIDRVRDRDRHIDIIVCKVVITSGVLIV